MGWNRCGAIALLAFFVFSFPSVDSFAQSAGSAQGPSAAVGKDGQIFGVGRYVAAGYSHLFPGIEAGYVFAPKYMRLGIGAGVSYYNPFRLDNVPLYSKVSIPVTFLIGTPVYGEIVSMRGYYRAVFLAERNGKGLSANSVAGAALELWMSRLWSVGLGFESGLIGSPDGGKEYFYSSPYAGVRFQL
jgi:hypothetical protein